MVTNTAQIIFNHFKYISTVIGEDENYGES